MALQKYVKIVMRSTTVCNTIYCGFEPINQKCTDFSYPPSPPTQKTPLASLFPFNYVKLFIEQIVVS
jgi:hypothetical protein